MRSMWRLTAGSGHRSCGPGCARPRAIISSFSTSAVIIPRDRWREVIAPVRTGRCDVAVAVPSRDGAGPVALGSALASSLGLISRLVLGTSDVFSGLFALDRSVWERAGSESRAGKEPGARLAVAAAGTLHRRQGQRRRSLSIAPGPLLGSAAAQARARQPFRQLLAAGPVLHGRRVGDGRRPDLLRALPVAACRSRGWPTASRPFSAVPGTWRSPPRWPSRSRWSGTSRLNRRLTFNDAQEGLDRASVS